MYISYFGHGMSLSIVGPSMLDLQISTSSTLEQVGFTIIGRASGMAVGSLLNTILHKFMDLQLLLALSLGIGCAFQAYIPNSPNVACLIGCFFANGACMGIVETCCNAYLIKLWGGKRCASFLQALFFSFGLGCLLAPLVVRPFLLPVTEEMMLEGNSPFSREDVMIRWPFVVVAVVLGFSSLLWFYIYFFMKGMPPTEGDTACPSKDGSTTSIGSNSSTEKETTKQKVLRYSANLTGMIFVFFYCGIEVALGSYLTPFAVKSDMHLSKSTGALMSSTYWMTFTFARLATIFYIDFVGPRNNLIIALALIAGSNIFLTPFGNTIEWCLWAGISLIGIGMSSVWGTLFAFISYHVNVSETVTSLIVSSACMGECVIPIVFSALLDKDVRVFLWITLACSIVLVALFVFLYLTLFLYSKGQPTKSIKHRDTIISTRHYSVSRVPSSVPNHASGNHEGNMSPTGGV